MINDSNQSATTTSPLERLLSKYGSGASSTAAAAFQSASLDSRTQTRMSSTPGASRGEIDTAKVYGEMAGIHHDLAALADEYGKLNISFANVLGKDGIMEKKEIAALMWYSLPFVGNANKKKDIKINAYTRKGSTLVTLTDKMGEVLQQQYQNAQKGLEVAKQVQIENVAHLKLMDKAWIERLTESYTSTADLDEATKEARKLDSEISEIDSMLLSYEQQVGAARNAGDVTQIKQLTEEMRQVLDIKYGVLDAKLAHDGVVSEIRRNMLKQSEGVQSAKGAIAATKVNYAATTLWIDSMYELSFKYDHALTDFLPVFKAQAKIGAGAMEGLEMEKALSRVAEITNRLMVANKNLTITLGKKVFAFIQKPIYDPKVAGQVLAEIEREAGYLNNMKREFVEANQSIIAEPQLPGYTKVK